MKLPAKYSELKSYQKREARLQYIEQQDNLCWHCKGNLDEVPPDEILKKRINLSLYHHGFLLSPIHLHHDHDTDLTIGAVHAYCNAVLWEYHGQ